MLEEDAATEEVVHSDNSAILKLRSLDRHLLGVYPFDIQYREAQLVGEAQAESRVSCVVTYVQSI